MKLILILQFCLGVCAYYEQKYFKNLLQIYLIFTFIFDKKWVIQSAFSRYQAIIG